MEQSKKDERRDNYCFLVNFGISFAIFNEQTIKTKRTLITLDEFSKNVKDDIICDVFSFMKTKTFPVRKMMS